MSRPDLALTVLRSTPARALAGAALGFASAFCALDLVSLAPYQLPEAVDVRLRIPPETREHDVAVGFITTAIAEPRGFELAQGHGVAPHRIAFRAAVIEHDGVRFLLNSGLSSGHGPDTLGTLVWNPFGDVETIRDVGDALARVPISFVLLTSTRWYDVGGVATLPSDTPIQVTTNDRWMATTGPWPRRYGVDLDWTAPWIERTRTFGWPDAAMLGFRRSHDLFGDGSVIAVSLKGAAHEEPAVFVQLPSGRRLLLVGDAVWTRAQVDGRFPRHPVSTWLHDVNRMQLAYSIGVLHELGEQPGLEVIPLLDGDLDLPEYPEVWR